MKNKLKIKNPFLPLIQKEEGSVLIIAAVSMVVFMVILALILDIGMAYLHSGELQKVADASVYSAGRKLPVKQTDIDAVNDIKDAAIHYANLNNFSQLTRDDVVLGDVVRGYYTYIKVTVSNSYAMNFARVLGVNSIDISRSAKVMLSPTSKVSGAVPLGLLDTDLRTRIENNQTSHVVLKYGSGGSTQGFFGAIDLDGSHGGGASDYRRWLAQGYIGETVVGDILLEENGNMVGATYTGFNERYNGCTHFGATTGGEGCTIDHYVDDCPRIAKIVIYDINSEYTAKVVGFASFILEEQTDTGYITGSFLGTRTTNGQGSGLVAGSDSDYGLYTLMLSE